MAYCKYYNKYYTQRSVIETLRSDYDALYRATDDDARKLVENGAKIEELEAALKVVDDDKENVIKLIAKIPADFEYTDGYVNGVGSVVVPLGVVENVEELHAFLYPKSEYTVSETVREIASEIEELSGYSRQDIENHGE